MFAINNRFISEKDPNLLKQQEFIGNYLGMLQIWTKVARLLEPLQFGAIGKHHEIVAVLFRAS
ncbi:MAG: hypothetical protein HQM14_17490 [SAR324 cluster bacterium]|nr:hypothetical protein [SAR324 cluster bacterium]